MEFNRNGILFKYPDNWIIEENTSPDGVFGITVSAPDGAFWSLSRQPAGADFEYFINSTTEQLRGEYPDLEVYPRSEDISGTSLSGADFNFSYLDLTNTAEVRCLSTPTACYVVFCQAEDRDWSRLHHVFKAMVTSFIRETIGNNPSSDK